MRFDPNVQMQTEVNEFVSGQWGYIRLRESRALWDTWRIR